MGQLDMDCWLHQPYLFDNNIQKMLNWKIFAWKFIDTSYQN